MKYPGNYRSYEITINFYYRCFIISTLSMGTAKILAYQTDDGNYIGCFGLVCAPVFTNDAFSCINSVAALENKIRKI